MNKISGIYKIENLMNHKLYIGQSDDLYRREKSHFECLRGNRHHNKHLQYSFNKYGENNFKFEIIEECNVNVLDERETYWISHFDSFKHGYNQNIGGNGNRGWIVSEESRLKMSLNHADFSGENNWMYGKSLYDILDEDGVKKWKHNISIANTGEKNGFYGKHHTDETKAKISRAKIGKYIGKLNPLFGTHHTEEQNKKVGNIIHERYVNGTLINPNKISVVCLNTMKIFNSITEAGTYYDICPSAIVECGNGNYHTAGTINGVGLVWMHYDEYLKNKDNMDIDKIIIDANNKRNRKGEFSSVSKQVICLNTKQIFGSARQAGLQLHIDNSSISKCCKEKLKFAGKDSITNEKLIWMFYGDYIANQAKAC
jgi:group I intron endonuclease